MSVRPEKRGSLAPILEEDEPRRGKRLSPEGKRTLGSPAAPRGPRGKAPLPGEVRKAAPPARDFAPLFGGFLLAVVFPFSALTMVNPQWTGTLGQMLEAAVFGLSGSTSLLVPLLALSYALHFLLPRQRRPIQMTWAPTLLWFNLIVLAQRMGAQGGRLGSWVDGALVALVGPVGSWLMALACLPLCILAVCRVPPHEAGQSLAAMLHGLQDRLGALFAWLHTPPSPEAVSGEWSMEQPALPPAPAPPPQPAAPPRAAFTSLEDEDSGEGDCLPFDLSPPPNPKRGAGSEFPAMVRPTSPPMEKITFLPQEAPPAAPPVRAHPVEPLEPLSLCEPVVPPSDEPASRRAASEESLEAVPSAESAPSLEPAPSTDSLSSAEAAPSIEPDLDLSPEASAEPVADREATLEDPRRAAPEPLTPPRPRSQSGAEKLRPEFLEPSGQLRLFPSEARPPAPQYKLPPLALLNDAPMDQSNRPVEDKSHFLLDALASFGVQASLLDIVRGPTVTRYELQPARGVKVSRFTSLTNDIALALAATAVRIEAPIPGKSAIGIEIPNQNTDLVVLKDILASSRFRKSSGLSIALGKDLGGNPSFTNLQKMPHLLVAGTTGSGKSVCVNGLILSLMYRFSPRQLQLLMIDPKQVELSIYEGIPHLISLSRTPESKSEGAIICDPKRAAMALHQIVELMEYRYGLFAAARVRNLEEFNQAAEDPLPWVVVIIDELADLMMVAAKTVETSICRIAQKARAAGIHLVLATQRPSADVITGLIKVNVPSRIAFAVSSQVDSRVILDTGGAEQLLGKGDMLFCPVDASDPRRLQGCYVTNEEILRIVEWWKAQASPENLIRLQAQEVAEEGGDEEEGDADDAMVEQALAVVLRRQQASASLLQTELKVGYARARRLIYLMEKKGYIGPAEGSKPRKILYPGSGS